MKEDIDIQKLKLGLTSSRARMMAATMAAVETMKDQGFCRWNYIKLRSLHQHANTRSASQAKNKVPSSSSSLASRKLREDKAKRSEESLRKVMYLSCWGPY